MPVNKAQSTINIRWYEIVSEHFENDNKTTIKPCDVDIHVIVSHGLPTTPSPPLTGTIVKVYVIVMSYKCLAIGHNMSFQLRAGNCQD